VVLTRLLRLKKGRFCETTVSAFIAVFEVLTASRIRDIRSALLGIVVSNRKFCMLSPFSYKTSHFLYVKCTITFKYRVIFYGR